MVWPRPIAGTLLLVTVACSSVQPIARPREFIATRQPQTVWVTTAEWSEPVPLVTPQVSGDTLRGTLYGEPTALPLSTVSSVQAAQYSRKKTYLAAAGGAVAGGILIAVLATRGGTPNTRPDPDNCEVIRNCP